MSFNQVLLKVFVILSIFAGFSLCVPAPEPHRGWGGGWGGGWGHGGWGHRPWGGWGYGGWRPGGAIIIVPVRRHWW
nr:PREDICTED: major prion protein-like [Tribolium castaneum]|eukprot:XP_008195185.1 PREDICTED: major prion protein-like [Tribolium castaneum]